MFSSDTFSGWVGGVVFCFVFNVYVFYAQFERGTCQNDSGLGEKKSLLIAGTHPGYQKHTSLQIALVLNGKGFN